MQNKTIRKWGFVSRRYSYGITEKGFTLMELIVVFAVMGSLTALTLSTYESGESQTRISAQEMASNIRKVQSNTLGAVGYEGDIPEGGWGAYFTEGDGEYILYADTDTDHEFDPATEKWRKKELPNGMKVTSVSEGSVADITFEPPDPTTYINGSTTEKITITLADDENNKAQVRVNFFGLIEVVND